jgi:predicted nucleic acid-binding protein
MIVVDTNVIAYLFVTDPHTSMAERALEKERDWAAPLLWRSEFRNILGLYIRKGILQLTEAQQIMRTATQLMRYHEYDVASDKVLATVASSACTAYDCEFVALARDLGVALVTVDTQLLRAFPGIAVSLADFADQAAKAEK